MRSLHVLKTGPRRRRRYPLLCLGLCLAGLACAPPADRVDAVDEQAVRDTLAVLAAQFSQAYMDGDVDAMMTLYTDDAVVFPGNSEYLQGQEALRRYWALPEGRRITHHKITPVEVEVSGDMASDFGHYEVSGVNGEQAWGPSHGKYLIVWKRGDDGRWRMHLDMWNSRPSPEG